MFSRWSSSLLWKDFGCRSKLATMLTTAYTPGPAVVQLGGPEAVANWSDVVQPRLLASFKGLHEPQSFAFVRTVDGDCELWTKNRCSDKDWLGEDATHGVR